MVWCGVVWCGVVWCGVVWCGVMWCGVVWCGVVWCGVVCRRRCYQMAKGRDVYPRAKVNGLGCVCGVRAVCKCVVALPGPCTPAMHCLTALGQWAVELLQYTAALPGGSGQWTSCNTLPHCLGAVGSATPAMHCLTAWGQWAVQLLQRTAPLPGGSGQCNSRNALPHCLGAVDSATPAMHCLTALGQWAVELLQYTAALLWGQWAVELLQCTAPLPGGSGQRNSCNTVPHCLGAVGSRTPAMHCLTALGAVGSGPPAMLCTPAWGGRGVQPRGRSEYSSGPMGRRHRPRAGRTGLGGTGSPALGVVGLSEGRREGRLDRVTGLFQGWRGRGWEGGHPATGKASRTKQGTPHQAGLLQWQGIIVGVGGRRAVCAVLCCVLCCVLCRAGSHHFPRTGRTGLGGAGSPAQGVVGVPCWAHGEASSSENRAHRPGGDGGSSPGGGRSLLRGPWGAIIFLEPGAPAWGGRGVQPRGWSEYPAGPMGRRHLRRTGHTGLGGTGGPAQGVVGASF